MIQQKYDATLIIPLVTLQSVDVKQQPRTNPDNLARVRRISVDVVSRAYSLVHKSYRLAPPEPPTPPPSMNNILCSIPLPDQPMAPQIACYNQKI